MYSIKEEFNGGMTTLEDKEYEGDETPKIRESTGRWTTVEHQLFLRGLELYGKGWKKIACLIKTRSVVQIRTHAQKYFSKLSKARQSGGNAGGESLGGLDLNSHKRKKRAFKRKVSVSRPLAPYVRLSIYPCKQDQMGNGGTFSSSSSNANGTNGAAHVVKSESIDVNESLYNFLSPVLTDPSSKGGEWYRSGMSVDSLLDEVRHRQSP